MHMKCRMNKFLLLIRRYLQASFRFLSRNKWSNATGIARYLDILRATPLNPSDNKIPNGLRYHVIDIYVDELDKVDEARDGNMPLEKMLEPLRELNSNSPTKAVRNRAKEALEDDRLKDWSEMSTEKDGGRSAGEEGQEEDEEEEWGGIED